MNAHPCIIAVFAITLFAAANSATGGEPLGPIVSGRAFHTFELEITDVSPKGILLEHQPIQVSFRVRDSKVGVVGTLSPLDVSVVGASKHGTSYKISGAMPPRTYAGTIQSLAPAAGAAVPVRIVLVTPQKAEPGREPFGDDELASAEVLLPVAARYEVEITGFSIEHTRAQHEDTVKIDLRGVVDGQLSASPDACNIVGPPTYCVKGVPQGDHNDGDYVVTNVRVGPFDLVPEVDPNLGFYYVLMNLGHPETLKQLQVFLDFMSGAASAFLSGYTGSSGWKTVDEFTRELNEIQWGGCDGPVAIGAHMILNQTVVGQSQSTLEVRTRESGRFGETSGPYGENIVSQRGCGKSPRYKVSWAVVRTSWKG